MKNSKSADLKDMSRLKNAFFGQNVALSANASREQEPDPSPAPPPPDLDPSSGLPFKFSFAAALLICVILIFAASAVKDKRNLPPVVKNNHGSFNHQTTETAVDNIHKEIFIYDGVKYNHIPLPFTFSADDAEYLRIVFDKPFDMVKNSLKLKLSSDSGISIILKDNSYSSNSFSPVAVSNNTVISRTKEISISAESVKLPDSIIINMYKIMELRVMFSSQQVTLEDVELIFS